LQHCRRLAKAPPSEDRVVLTEKKNIDLLNNCTTQFSIYHEFVLTFQTMASSLIEIDGSVLEGVSFILQFLPE
jgi:hypothetical protein